MSDPKIRTARSSTGSPESLTETAGIALAESTLDKVAGGVTVNKAKTADKAQQQMDAYIKS
ncbi:MAG TPA: hypothetical protein VHA35_10655 [Dongiaceae bacterium]|nr:hypothetical protein [Dongiaceae bacterium]